MPTYEYECTNCGKVFELFQSIKDKPRRRVSQADKNCSCTAPVRRLIGTGGGIIFKGSGFYQTDYRSEGYKKAQKAETETVTSGSSASSADAPKSDGKKAGESKADSGGAETKKPTSASGKPARKASTVA